MGTSGEKALTPAKVETLLNSVNDLTDEALLKLAIGGGLRREDIVKVFVKDVNIKEGSVTFYQKKKSNHHTVYLPPSVMLTLEKLINLHKERKTGNPYLFPAHGFSKKPISSRTAYNILQKHLKAAGMESIPFHALRGTCVKLCQAKGWNTAQTAKHIDDRINTVLQYYATPSESERKEAAKEKAIL